MMHVFKSEQWVPFPRDLVFAFFANPRNLPPLMPHWQRARIDAVHYRPPPPRPEGTAVYPGVTAGNGTRLTITARALPLLPLRGAWVALIEDFRWNEGFCDVQLRGPFAYWKHCHSVHDAPSADDGTPGTIIRDHVTFSLPLDALTRVGLPAVQVAFATLFGYRQAQTVKLLPRLAEASAKPL